MIYTFYVLLAAGLWGLSGVCAQFLFQQRDIAPEWLVAVRMLIPGIILLIKAYYSEGMNIFRVWRYDLVHLLIYSIFGIMFVQLSYFIAIKHSNAATATIIQFTNPAFIAIAMGIHHRRFPSVTVTISIVMALVGIFFLATHGNINTLTLSTAALVWGVLSAMAVAFYTLYSSRLIRPWGQATIIGWSMLVGGVVMSTFHQPWDISGVWDIYTISATIFVVIFGSLITFYLFLLGVQKLGGEKASILNCAEPLAAAVFSMWLLGIKFIAMDWLGTFFIVAAVIVQTTNGKKVH